jgi:tetratricopeptide (TPR) repeat protein
MAIMKVLRFPLLFLGSFSVLPAAESPLRDQANALFVQEKWAEARTLLKNRIADQPQNAEAHFLLGRALLNQDKAEEAVPVLEKATALAPDNSEYFNRLGDAYGRSAQKAGVLSRLGWARKCLAAYEKAVALDPKNVDAHDSLMNFYAQAPGFAGGGMDKAYAQAQEIKQLDPVRGRAVFAQLYVADKKYDQAFGLLADTLKEKPDDYTALYQTGRLAAILGERLEQGRETLQKCLGLTPPRGQPGHDAVNWRLGMIFEKQGEKSTARSLYEAALKLNPKFQPAIESLKKLN